MKMRTSQLIKALGEGAYPESFSVYLNETFALINQLGPYRMAIMKWRAESMTLCDSGPLASSTKAPEEAQLAVFTGVPHKFCSKQMHFSGSDNHAILQYDSGECTCKSASVC